MYRYINKQKRKESEWANYIKMVLLVRKIVVPQQQKWKKDELYESVFAIRMVLAMVIGVMCGLGKMEGLYVFLTYVVMVLLLLYL